MSDLTPAERKAMEVAQPKLEAFQGARAREGFESGWLAARDYYTAPSYCAECKGPCRDEGPFVEVVDQDEVDTLRDRIRVLEEALAFYAARERLRSLHGDWVLRPLAEIE